MNDPYAMPNGVLRNKLGITDHQRLAAAEADITRARLAMLAERPTPERSSDVAPPPLTCGISPGRNSSSDWPSRTAT
ncbi:hypothetical protein OG562_11385 [Streptomyces sp. NBC_01275]|uniref:hypothetical protein n=1 Tax=Streptomyces sp. NBC_01275 TaxID=2903807 RepID=UPI00224EBCA3|nr:hypothetical protein [Streptomyces sp. NBC_01275]MCX4761571.1 hypothetical protein [Streptomyces sp. NBC_01275]